MWPVAIEVGSCRALISKIQTTIDGGLRLTLDLNPDDEKLVSSLMALYARGNRLLQVGILSVGDDE
jgi:hypothetical protein